VLIFLACTGTVRSAKSKPTPCPGGRYIVAGSELVTGDSTGSIEPVVIGTQIAIGNACSPVHANLKATRHGTSVKAVWPSCTGLVGKVKLRGTLDTTCTTLDGTLIAKKPKLKKTFVARVTRCGDGVVDAGNGEECDGGVCGGGSACTADCTCVPAPSTTTSTSTTTTVPGPLDPVPCNADGLDARVCLVMTDATALQISGVAVEVSYPPPLSIPGSGLAPSVRQRVMDLTGGIGLSQVADVDTNGDGVDETVRTAYATPATKIVPFGPFELIHFDCPAGSLVRAHDVPCTITDASDPLGDSIDPGGFPVCVVGVAPHGGAPNEDCPGP
jgi:hypothetical protein